MAHKYELQTQTEWNWNIAIYLFLAGVGAGGYATGVVAGYGGAGWEPVARAGVSLGFPLLLIGTVFLVLDLGVKLRALRVFLNPGTSWIARGSWIISIFMILSFLHLVLMTWPEQLAVDAPVLQAIGTVNLVFSVLVMVYTGVLLGASRAIAFWNTAMLPLLFLVSACSTGVMATLLLTPSPGVLPEGITIVSIPPASALAAAVALLVRVHLGLVVAEGLVIAFYLQASHRTDESRASVHMLLRGRLAPAFWIGLVTVGLLVPLILGIVEVALVDEAAFSTNLWTIRIAAWCGLFGGLMLRRLVLAAGVRTPLRAAGIDFTFPKPVHR